MQLETPINVITPLGPALAMFLEGGNVGREWICFIKATGEPWAFRNPYVRLAPDISDGRGGAVSPFLDVPPGLEKHIARYKENGWIPK